MSSEPIAFDAPLVASITAVAGVAVALSIGAIVAAGWSAGVGVAVGGLVATVNLWMFAYIGRNVLAGGRRRRIWGVLGGLKVIALFGALFVLLHWEVVTGLTLAIGYGSLPLGIAIAGVLGPRPGDDDEPTSTTAKDLLNAAPTSEAPRD